MIGFGINFGLSFEAYSMVNPGIDAKPVHIYAQ